MIDKKMESKKKEPDIKKEDDAQNNKDQIEINNKNLDKVKDLENELTELNNKYLRLLAENQNIRKNHDQEKEDI